MPLTTVPFALSLSKGCTSLCRKKGQGFDRLSPNGVGAETLIARLSGTLAETSADSAVIDVGGVGYELEAPLEERIRFEIRRHASPRHVPARIVQVSDIPRTKNGKVVELAVKSVVHGMPVSNTDALANPEALELFKDLDELRT